jgi:hypothetical protein
LAENVSPVAVIYDIHDNDTDVEPGEFRLITAMLALTSWRVYTHKTFRVPRSAAKRLRAARQLPYMLE